MNEKQILFNTAYYGARDRPRRSTKDFCELITPSDNENLSALVNDIKSAYQSANDSKQDQDFREIFQAQMQEIAWRFKLEVPQ